MLPVQRMNRVGLAAPTAPLGPTSGGGGATRPGAASPRRAPGQRRRRPGPHWTVSAAGDPTPGGGLPRRAIHRYPPPAPLHPPAPSPRRVALRGIPGDEEELFLVFVAHFHHAR